MNRLNYRNVVSAALIAGLIPACTWVPLETHGATVEVAAVDQNLRSCQKLGETTVSVKNKVWIYQRNRNKIEQELENLARNEAAERNADTIQAITPVNNGERMFGIYACLE